jgi:hypothetical protein
MGKRSVWRHPFLSLFLGAHVGAVAWLSVSCAAPATLPGTSLGTYNVTGMLGINTCGAGLGAPSPWTFTTQMSEDGTTLYWETSEGTELSGTMASATEVSISSILTANVDTTEAGAGPCDLQNTTVLDLALAAGASPSSFTGTITYTFAAATGVSSSVNCTDQLSASGGPYDTLPCTASYSLAGTQQ